MYPATYQKLPSSWSFPRQRAYHTTISLDFLRWEMREFIKEGMGEVFPLPVLLEGTQACADDGMEPFTVWWKSIDITELIDDGALPLLEGRLLSYGS